jgi:glycosyltransferase involved in cell wall biosynthesis
MRFTDTNMAGCPTMMPAAPLLESSRVHVSDPRVAIVMCTYNGAAYIQKQLDSFADQTFTNWTLYVSDDSSTDATRQILTEYQSRWGSERLVIFSGPCRGFAANFVSLIQRPEVVGDYFAFSDQDDVWFADKLQRSLSRLAPVGAQTPALYCSRTRLIDAAGKVIGFSPLFPRQPSFQNALVQSIAGANTMLVNRAGRELLLQLPDEISLVAHDWLAYLLISGCGGKVFYDVEPCLDYRQHDGNLIGANASFRDRLIRLRQMVSGRFAQWNDANTSILKRMCLLLTEENREVLAFFDVGRKLGFIKRVAAVKRSGVYRQTPHGNLSLFLAVCLGKI